MLTVIGTLLLAALALWAIAQLPLDATIVKIIRIVVVVACVLFVMSHLGLLPPGLRWH